MNKETYNDVLLKGLIFVLGVALGGCLGATVIVSLAGDKPSYECAQYEQWWVDQCIPYWKLIAVKTITDPITLFTALLTAFTGGLLVFTFRLWRAGQVQIGVARETLIAQTRPWLVVEKVSLNSLRSDGEIINVEAEFTVRNIGASPALNVTIIPELTFKLEDAFRIAFNTVRPDSILMAFGTTVFQDKDWKSETITCGLEISKSAPSLGAVAQITPKGGILCIYVMFEIWYEFVGSERGHVTAGTYCLMQTSDAGYAIPLPAEEAFDANVSRSSIKPIGKIYAD